jgi:hypothetical protein
VNERIDIGIRALLEGKLDVAADRPASPEPRSLVAGFHDAGAGAGDDVESRHGQQARCLHCRVVMGIVGTDSRRTENRDRFLDRGQRVEPVDELAHDAHHAPRVGSREIDSRTRLLQDFFVFGYRRRIANRFVDRSRHGLQLSRSLLRGRRSTRLQMPFLGPLLESLERLLLGGCHHFGIQLLATGRARLG